MEEKKQKIKTKLNKCYGVQVLYYTLFLKETEIYIPFLEAHKVILSACSPFFRSVLKKNKHDHPLVYLKVYNTYTTAYTIYIHKDHFLLQYLPKNLATVSTQLPIKNQKYVVPACACAVSICTDSTRCYIYLAQPGKFALPGLWPRIGLFSFFVLIFILIYDYIHIVWSYKLFIHVTLTPPESLL